MTTTARTAADQRFADLCIKLMDGFLTGKYTLRVGQYAPTHCLSGDCPVTDDYRDDTNDWMEEFFGVTELEDMSVAIVNETLVCMTRPTLAMFRRVLGDAFGAVFNAANSF